MNEFVKKVSQKIDKLSNEQLERLIADINAQNDTFDSILESLPIGLIILNKDWHVMQINKAAERLLPFKVRPGEQKKENTPVWELIDEALIASFLQSAAANQKSNTNEEFSLNIDEKVRFVTIAVTPLVQQHLIAGSIVSVTDITEKRQQEILLHRMESLAGLTNLAASVAHEIKNPLGAISIHIQLLQKAIVKSRQGSGALPDEKFMEHYLDIINEEIDNLNKIVVDFLFAVRPVQANMVLASPNALLEKIVAFFQPEFESKGISVTLRLCPESPRLLIDEKLFRECIMNLAQNALAAIVARFPTGNGRQDEYAALRHGELVLESFIKDSRYIMTMADNGIGMDGTTAAKIFEPYYTTKVNGTGLGLTMVYKIIKEFRGDIDVKSVLGHGTVFTVVLPIPQLGTQLLEDKSEQ